MMPEDSRGVLAVPLADVRALRACLLAGGVLAECREELERMVETASVLAWRADCGRSCVGWKLAFTLSSQECYLREALHALDRGDRELAALLLDGFEQFAQR